MLRAALILIAFTQTPAHAATICSDIFIQRKLEAPADIAESIYAELDKKLPGKTKIDLRQNIVLRVDEQGNDIGELTYALHLDVEMQPTVEVITLSVDQSVRQSGMSRLLLAALLKELPPVTQIVSETLVGSNFKAFKLAEAQGASENEAIKQTPAYRVRKSLGFGKIDYKNSILSSDEALRLVVEPGVENPPPATFTERIKQWWTGQ